jgi:hypothetical protein
MSAKASMGALAATGNRNRLKQSEKGRYSLKTAGSRKDKFWNTPKGETGLCKGADIPADQRRGINGPRKSRMAVMKKEPRSSASHAALSHHAKSVAKRRKSS